MKKLLYRLGCILPLLGLASCLGQVGFDPENMIPDDLPSISLVSPNAILVIQNHTKSLDITSIKIKDPDIGSIVGSETGKPKAGFEKSFSLQPKGNDHSYEITIAYAETVPKNDGFNSESSGVTGTDFGSGSPQTFHKALPSKGVYNLHFYRNDDGKVVLEDNNEALENNDDRDHQDTQQDPLDAGGGGEGSIDVGLSNENRSHVGLLILKNLTKINTDSADFAFWQNNGSAFPVTNYTMVPGPANRDQRSILLGPNDWKMEIEYTIPGRPAAKTWEKTVTVSAGGVFYAYFYKTANGSYAVSTQWPPIPDDSDKDGNSDPSEVVDPATEGILEITNKSETGAIIDTILIDGTEHKVSMLAGDPAKRFILPIGTVNVAFKPVGKSLFGLTIAREIRGGQTTTLAYTDSLSNPDVIPPGTGFGAGLIKVINQSTGIVVDTTIYDWPGLEKSTGIHWSDFKPPIPVNYNRTGNMDVIGTSDFPIQSGQLYLIQVVLETTDGLVIVEELGTLYDQIKEIVITQDKVDKGTRTGSRVTIYNNTDTPSTIIGMKVFPANDANKSVAYNVNIVKGGSAAVYVLSVPGFPIVQGMDYKAALTVYGNGNIGIIEKGFDPNNQLYHTNPDQNLRTVTLVQSDIEGRNPPLVEEFIPVTGISGIPSLLASQLNHDNTPKVMGSINLNSVAVVEPSTATTKSPVVWEKNNGGGTGNYTLTNGVLTVDGRVNAGGDTAMIKATIANAAGSASSKGPFTTTFTISLTFSQDPPPVNKVTGITWDAPSATVGAGDSINLASKATINPSNAHINNVPITVNDIQWSIVSGGDKGSLSGVSNQVFTAGNAGGTVTVTATLPAAYTSSGNAITQNITVTILPPPPPPTRVIRVMNWATTDTLKRVVFVPTNNAYSEDLYLTGHTAEAWATKQYNTYYDSKKNDSFINLPFIKDNPDVLNITLGSGLKNSFMDITVPKGRYYVFFVEGDGRTRGYCNPPTIDPPYGNNYRFLVDTDKIKDYYFVGMAEKPEGTAGGAYCLPIFYHSNYNVADIGTKKLKK
ncbi:MAG: hypothetical protein LBD37_04685 [Treponema sp.]|jgi:hypothetical protein|nr:hypothetical protein [Treponema sp.]